jgi:glycosyltransferase involved in cell wall biosynthesis
VLVVPSRGLESFGLVVREAAHAGVPSVVAERGALIELAGSGGCLGFDPDRPGGLRDALVELAAPGRLDRLRDALPATKGMDEHCREIDAFYGRALGLTAGGSVDTERPCSGTAFTRRAG